MPCFWFVDPCLQHIFHRSNTIPLYCGRDDANRITVFPYFVVLLTPRFPPDAPPHVFFKTRVHFTSGALDYQLHDHVSSDIPVVPNIALQKFGIRAVIFLFCRQDLSNIFVSHLFLSETLSSQSVKKSILMA